MAQSKLRSVTRKHSEDDDDDAKSVKRQQGTVGHLQEVFVQDDRAFKEIYEDLVRTISGKEFHYSHIRGTDAPRAKRSEVPYGTPIKYWLYNAPGFWGDRHFSVMRWQVTADEADSPGFFSHTGEELLYTPDDGLYYGFFSPRRSDDLVIKVPAERIVRVHPEVPHRNFKRRPRTKWRDPEGPSGWIILRSESDTQFTSAYPEEPESGDTQHDGDTGGAADDAADDNNHPRRTAHKPLTRKKLQDASVFAMHAWGIGEQIRWQRQKAGLTINELAQLTAMNASYLGRLEKGEVNISIPNLRRIAQLVGLNLTRLEDAIRATDNPMFLERRAPGTHWLHAHRHVVEEKGRLPVKPPKERLAGESSTWIVVEGELVFQLDVDGTPKPLKEFVSGDDVVHLREPIRENDGITFTALERSVLLEIRYSAHCTCADEVDREN